LDQRVSGLPPATIDIVRDKIAGAFRNKLIISMVCGGESYRKLYDLYPQGTRIHEFTKNSGDQGRSMHEHICQFLA
jgi:hypothetical protein